MILETIAVISAANSAFATIKEAVQNGQDLMECGSHLADYFGAKSEIQKRANEAGQSDLELFMAKEKLKKQEDELKNIMIWQGRGGMWQDWLAFQAEQKKAREDAKKEEERKRLAKRKAIKNGLIITGGLVGAITLIGVIGLVIYWLVSAKGH